MKTFTLEKEKEGLQSNNIERDDFIINAEKVFDCSFKERTYFPWKLPEDFPEDFQLCVIFGKSGIGKTTLLHNFGIENPTVWDSEKAIISHFPTYEEAKDRLLASGLNNIPCWYKPFHHLSNGEQFRANLSRNINSNVVFDEFTSTVDRATAISCSNALNQYVKKKKLKKIVLSTCNYDIIPYLKPDILVNLNEGKYYTEFFHQDQTLQYPFMNQKAAMSGLNILATFTI